MTTPSRSSRVLRVVGIVLVSLLVCAVAVRAGFWQHGRHVERADAIALYEANAEAEPVPLAEAVPEGEAVGDAEWTRVTVEGEFVQGSTTLLRNRPVDRQRTWHLLAWFDTVDGRALMVDAGWVPIPESGEPADVVPDLPEGPVTLTVVLRAAEPDDGRRDEGATRITPAQMPAPDAEAIDGYGMVREICGADGCVEALGSPVPLPHLSLGSHLAYTWQWFGFAVIAPIGGVLLARRDWQLTGEDGDDAPRPARASSPPKTPRRRRERGPSDEEIEDAL
ncbi:SURF1 family protein [Demequina mangrovi]|uniref:SURF1-like protein n=1 Tax=Demequina mangrovi TaxID=1043493 RepID=A0A1H7B5D8_9MICO|nr:SURF1 family protein [Demequina mangrovi]SEJ69652.1 Cytochrome oxidase assembly protein ShyY1 [Demequina mangrovi]